MDIWRITLSGILTGVIGTGLGGFAGIFCRRQGSAFLSAVLSYAAGVMLAVVTFGLLPAAFPLTSLPVILAGVGMGVLFLTLGEGMERPAEDVQRKYRMGLVIAAGIALHNFPEGLAIGSGMEAAPVLGCSLMLTILLHDIPEGLSMAIPLQQGGLSPAKSVLVCAVSGLPTGFGAFVGAAVGTIAPAVLAFCLSFAAGAMLYVAASDILPEAQTLYPGRISGIFTILGVITGMIISICI